MYTCAGCGGIFPWTLSVGEIAAEAAVNFPGLDVNDPAGTSLVCDACYKRTLAAVGTTPPVQSH